MTVSKYTRYLTQSGAILAFAVTALSATGAMAQTNQTTGQTTIQAPGPVIPPRAPWYRRSPSTNNTPSTSQPSTTSRQPQTRTARPSQAGQYASETEARARCLGGSVVWANTASKVYHYANTAHYGRTKKGAYMCERDTASAGMRAAKNETRPAT